MKKIRNKFIIFICLAIFGLLAFVFSPYIFSSSHESFVVLVKGKALLNKKLLSPEEKQNLSAGDVVRTIGEDSLAVIEWGDGSVTRLGGNSRIVVNEAQISHNLGEIRVSFDLLNGKTWSNVISFIGEDSYFKQTFRDNEAAVRGTVFSVDLDGQYIHVLDHKILLNDASGNTFEIEEQKPFSLKTFSFLRLDEFISGIKDSSFEQLNALFDTELREELIEKINSGIEKFQSVAAFDIQDLTIEKRQETYDAVMEIYQQLNFVDAGNTLLFEKKLEYKSLLLELASKNQKEVLVESTLLDLKDSIHDRNYDAFGSILEVLNNNLDALPDLDMKKYFENGIIPEGLQQSIDKNIEVLQNIFGQDISLFISNGTLNLEAIESIKQKAKQQIESGLDTLFGK